MDTRFRHPLWALVVTVALTTPWVASWVTGAADAFGTVTVVGISGLSYGLL